MCFWALNCPILNPGVFATLLLPNNLYSFHFWLRSLKIYKVILRGNSVTLNIQFSVGGKRFVKCFDSITEPILRETWRENSKVRVKVPLESTFTIFLRRMQVYVTRRMSSIIYNVIDFCFNFIRILWKSLAISVSVVWFKLSARYNSVCSIGFNEQNHI